jgi:hypothetical protein
MAQREGTQRNSSGRKTGTRSTRNGHADPAEIARIAVSIISQLTGRRPETVLGIRKDDDGWKVTLELVELSRVPNSTDLLGCYVVDLDDQGELVGYERVRRYQRGQAGGDAQ